jgi:hypothetical protein
VNHGAAELAGAGGAWIAHISGMEAIAWVIAAAIIAGVIGYTLKRKRRAHV